MQPRLAAHAAVVIAALAVALAARPVAAQAQPATATAPPAASAIALPAPQTDGGMPLMEALRRRATSRAFAKEALPPQTLANLLWAAFGINRPGEGKRTAPSAHNWQEVQVYVLLEGGAYVYDAKANALQPVASGDLRRLGGQQEFVRDAPVTLVYVADGSKIEGDPAQKQALAWADAAFVSENVYLFCASAGLATGVRAMIDRPALARALSLRDTQIVALAQSVGRPRQP